MRKPAAVLAGLALSLGCGAAVPFWGDRESSPVGTRPASLKECSFVWTPAAVASSSKSQGRKGSGEVWRGRMARSVVRALDEYARCMGG